MTDDTLLPFDLPAVCRKKFTVDFDGRNQSSDAGLLLLREAHRKFGVRRRATARLHFLRTAEEVAHRFVDMLSTAR